MLALSALSLLPVSVRGQSSQTGLEAYAEAVKQSVISERIAAMERYLPLAGESRLKVDALEFLVWDHLRLGHQTRAVQHARELQAIESANPLAIAILNQDSPTEQSRSSGRQRLAALRVASASLGRLRRPEGMPERNFQALRRQTETILNGELGLTYLASGDYLSARAALQTAVDGDPNNAQWIYGLALALLNGKNKDEYRGFWYLARAANLTEQMAQGREIAEYAKRLYRSSGGTDANWQTFVASAAALDAPPLPVGSEAQTASNTVGSNAGPAASPNSTPVRQADSTKSMDAPSSLSNSRPQSNRKSRSSAGFEATLREPDRGAVAPAQAPERVKGIAAPGQAISLGILIQTSLLTRENRGAIISTLKEIVRNLRSNDEACILVFSNELDFEQDLTGDDQLLEDALGQVRPRAGRALLSGISFAAGHLKRIGKNANRILLVISDGEARAATADTLAFRSQVTGVRIECVGLKAAGDSQRATLERIASYSGGKAAFAEGPEEFRTVALQVTRNIGIAAP